MTASSLADALATLREVNEHLGRALVQLRPERKRCGAITAADFSSLRAQISSAECFRLAILAGGREEHSELLRYEVFEYRRNLERLERFLPNLHLQLLAEKARLERARAEVAAKSAWAVARAEAMRQG